MSSNSRNLVVKIIASFEDRAVSFCTSSDTDQSGKASRSANVGIRHLATFEEVTSDLTLKHEDWDEYDVPPEKP